MRKEHFDNASDTTEYSEDLYFSQGQISGWKPWLFYKQRYELADLIYRDN